jgi:hypothetical protein
MAQTSGKSKKAAYVICSKHGIERNNVRGVLQLRVGMPQGKNARRFGGCPICRRESLQT